MSNKETLIKRLINLPPYLKEHLDYYMDVNNGDILYAFDDLLDMADSDVKLFNECKPILIDIGYVRPIDIRKVCVMGGKKYWFIKNKTHYSVVAAWQQWIEN